MFLCRLFENVIRATVVCAVCGKIKMRNIERSEIEKTKKIAFHNAFHVPNLFVFQKKKRHT